MPPVEIHVAGCIDRNLAGRAFAVAHGQAVRRPRRAPELARREFRQPRVAIDAERRLERMARGRRAVHRVHRLRDDRNAGEVAQRVGVRQHLSRSVASPRAPAAQHQVRKVDVPRMRRHVRAFRHVAEVAQVALVDDLAERGLRHLLDIAHRRVVDQIEQRRKRAAQRHAAPASGTDVEHARHLRIDRGRRTHRTASRADAGSGLRDCLPWGMGRSIQRGAHAPAPPARCGQR